MVKVAIFHEGNSKKTHDNLLLKLLLDHLDLDESQVKFVGVGIKSNFFKIDNKNYRELLIDIKRGAIKKALFVADADYIENDAKYGGFDNTKSELERTLEELIPNLDCDIYVTCDPGSQSGYLESLLLSTIPDNQKQCIDDFLECSNFKSKENHKSILNDIYRIGYPNAPFDLSHENFNELKSKLQYLFD